MSLELGLTSALNLQHIHFDIRTDAISTCIAIFIIAILLLLPFLILRILSARPSTFVEPLYKLKYGSMYVHSGRSEDYSRGIYYPILLMHRYFFILLYFCVSNGLLQALLMVGSTLLVLMYLILYKPFKTRFDIIFSILNTAELFLVYGACCIFCFLEHPSALEFRQ